MAVGAGFADGLGYGDNTKAAVIRLGMMEMIKFTEEFYAGEGTLPKSLMLKVVYPDDTKLSEKFSRDHHTVNYKKYYDNEPINIDGYDPEDNRAETDLFKFKKVKIN